MSGSRGHGRRPPALVVGLALVGSLWLGLVLAFVRLQLYPRLLAAHVRSSFVDVGMLALNAALLVAFVAIRVFHRSRRGDADEASG